jgi:hypothetical protein
MPQTKIEMAILAMEKFARDLAHRNTFSPAGSQTGTGMRLFFARSSKKKGVRAFESLSEPFFQDAASTLQTGIPSPAQSCSPVSCGQKSFLRQ